MRRRYRSETYAILRFYEVVTGRKIKKKERERILPKLDKMVRLLRKLREELRKEAQKKRARKLLK